MIRKKIICVIGTRPEAIKMAPVVEQLKQRPCMEVLVVITAQHRELLDQILEACAIQSDIDLNLMTENQTLSSLSARLIESLDKVFSHHKPDMVIAQGDTSTTMMAALTAFYHRIPFAHVESGLRTGDLKNPFPEEMNRVVVGRLATLHFAPTETARKHLLGEGIPSEKIFVTGNTVIDSLLAIANRGITPIAGVDQKSRLILLTIHRRESFGALMEQVFIAIRQIADRYKDINVLYPVHPNPNVRKLAYEILSGHPRIYLTLPMDYVLFVNAMRQAYLILTDSGGVQEEAPALAKPVLVLRTDTERPEAVEAGVVKIVGCNAEEIVKTTSEMLDDEAAYRAMAKGVSPYGDGKAAKRIAGIVEAALISQPCA